MIPLVIYILSISRLPFEYIFTFILRAMKQQLTVGHQQN